MIDDIGLRAAETAQVRTVLGLLRATVGHDLRGLILHGSAVAGGLRPDSDLDLLGVIARPLTTAERRVLIDGLLRASRSRGDPNPPRHLEVTLVVERDVRPWQAPPPLEFQYGDWWRPEFEAGVEAPWTTPNPDLAIVLTAARADGRALVGPAPAELLDPVPRADLEAALRAVVPDLLGELADDTRNVLLTLARIVRTLETGAIVPKDEAAAAAARDLESDGSDADAVAALRLAGEAYLGTAEDDWTDSATLDAARRAARALVNRIGGPTAGSSGS